MLQILTNNSYLHIGIHELNAYISDWAGAHRTLIIDCSSYGNNFEYLKIDGFERVLFLTKHDDIEWLSMIFNTNKCVFISTNTSVMGLFGILKDINVTKHNHRCQKSIMNLSFEQINIIKLMLQGKSQEEIAFRMNTNAKHVSYYKRKLMNIMGAKNNTQFIQRIITLERLNFINFLNV